MKQFSIHVHLLTHTLVLFGIGQFLALIIADRIQNLNTSVEVVSGGISLIVFLTYFALGTLLVLLLTKLYKGHLLYRLLFFLVLCAGLVTVFAMVLPLPANIFIAISFCLALYLLPIIWVHNIAIIIASAGIGALLGMQVSWSVALWLLIILSVYDLVAVFVTGHMVRIANAFIARQASFALIVPEHWRDLYARLSDVKADRGFLVLGGGDVVLPMITAVAVAPIHGPASLGVVVGALVGLICNHIVLMKWQRAIPALPLIALGSIIGMYIGFNL